MGFTIDTSGLSRMLYDMERRRLERQESFLRTAAAKLQEEAKQRAPWRDHTSHARGGITGRCERSGSRFVITLSGSVHYMVYLELAHGKKWAILYPTMRRNAEEILAGFARIGVGK